MSTLIVVEDLAAPAVIGRGGLAMYLLQFLSGLARLGHDVLFVEFLQEEPDTAAVRNFNTVGCNIGTERSTIPTLGIEWHHMWNPVVLDWWRCDPPLERDRFTTVGAWRDYGYLEWEGRVLGPKVEEFERFIVLPESAGEEL